MTAFVPQSLAILGRTPSLSVAELESLLGADNILPFGEHALLAVSHNDVPFDNLGGTIRLAKVLTPITAKSWRDIESYLLSTVSKHAKLIDGKITFGLSVFGFPATKEQIAKTALSIKKSIKTSGKPARMVPHSGLELSSATVFHNNLYGPNGWELLVVSDGKQTFLAQTTNIQDFEAYAARDQARPKRDARVGMLPPKLAQTIINLTRPSQGNLLLDPFCGTGVLLQEALLMGLSAYGTDLEPRMIEYSRTNLDWLITDLKSSFTIELEPGDATKHSWQPSPDVVAAETYLGPPLHQLPDQQKMRQIVHDISRLHNKFLENIGKQIKSGTRLCLAVPAWKTSGGFIHLSTLEKLKELGYTRMEFKHVRSQELIYHREGQLVARELAVLTKD